MKNFNLNKRTFLLAYILVSLFLIPIVNGFNINSQKSTLVKDYNIDSNLISNLSPSLPENDAFKQNVNYYSNNRYFDSKLTHIFSNESYLSRNFNQKVKIIVIFEDYVEKSDRALLMEQMFGDFTLLANYDIIPGVFVNIKLMNLYSLYDTEIEIKDIKKIHLSERFHNPYIDTEFPNSSSLDPGDFPNWWLSAVGAENLGYDGTGVRVAIVDTGVYDHLDYDVVLSRSFVSGEAPTNVRDDYGHGTHIAGIIGGDGSASAGKYRGIAPGVSLISARAGNYSGLLEGDIINAIDWAVKPIASGGADADIVSMSFGGGLPEADDPMTLTISSAANNYGAILVSSAGNSGPSYFTGGSPASGVDVISVGATDRFDNLASFSSWGPSLSYIGYPDIVAPGVNIIAPESPESVLSEQKRYKGDFLDYSGDSDYIPLSGTSMSCPFVSAALAILKEAFPTITTETAKIALIKGANKNLNEPYEYLKHGAGILNVSASLNYLLTMNNSLLDINDLAAIYPEVLPVKPFDLLNFPGDKQAFNLTVISGTAQTIDIKIPNDVDGLKLSLDKSQIIFSSGDISFATLKVLIKDDAVPGKRFFTLNITEGGAVLDSIDIAIDVKLQESKILMESYHGLNDWFPELSFYQMGFYESMKAITELNISVDYSAEYWSPEYDKNTDNSILTEERLFQYDLLVLQNPILPYSPSEINNIKKYFDFGGNILFLGTRHNDLCIDNVNTLFSELGIDLQVNQETITNENWLGIGTSIREITVTDFNSSEIFNEVDGFKWAYGNTFTSFGNTQPIASIDNKHIASSYDGRLLGKGRFVAFGDLHWLFSAFDDLSNAADHNKLLSNLMGYFLEKDDVSLNIQLSSERTSSAQVNITVHAKNLLTDSLISSSILQTRINVSVSHKAYFEEILMTSNNNGIAFNKTFSLPSTSYIPYNVNVNITIGGETYYKHSKILYFNPSEVPQINSLTIDNPVSRSGFENIDIEAQLDAFTYDSTTYMAVYTYSYFNTKQSINKTFSMTNVGATYSSTFTPDSSDPSGYVLAYIIPKNPSSNYSNPYSRRLISQITNNPPEFDELKSTVTVNGQELTLDETYDDETSYVITTSQGSRFDFNITVSDTVSYEDPNSEAMRVSVNLFIVSTTDDNFIMLIFPASFPLVELGYNPSQDTHVGSFTIPFNMQYSTIQGVKSLSTVSDYNFETGDGYLSILLITCFDSEGGSDEFILITVIQQGFQFDPFLMILILGIIAAVAITVVIVVVIVRRRRKNGDTEGLGYASYQSPYSVNYEETQDEQETLRKFDYCPYCGYPTAQKKFCPNCGKSLE